MARKKKAPRVIEGVLEDYFETGTEGVIWSVFEDDKKSYDGLHPIDSGDKLTIYNEDGTVRWVGRIDPDFKTGYQKYPMNPSCGQQVSCGRWVHWIQKGFDPDEWGKMFFQYEPRLRAKLEKRK